MRAGDTAYPVTYLRTLHSINNVTLNKRGWLNICTECLAQSNHGENIDLLELNREFNGGMRFRGG